MSKVETAHLMLDSGEPCFGMQVWEDDDGFRTRLLVERGGQTVGVVIHHGPDEERSGKIPPLMVPSTQGENPVGLMLQMSEEHRKDLRWYRRAMEMKAESTLIADVIRQDEEDRLALKGRSVFGPHQTTQRNPAYSHQTTLRNWWAERVARTGTSKSYREMRIRG